MKRSLPPFSAVRAFEAAARHLSFKNAAEELHVTQSAVSHQIKSLEEFLATTLFYRAANGVTLTPAGEEYFGDVSAILDQLEASTERSRVCELKGPLRLRSTPAFAARWLIKRINRFNARYPDVELHVTTSIEPTDFLTEDVDVLLQYGRRPASGLRVDPFLSSGRVPVCSPSFLDAGPPVHEPEDLLDHTLLRDVVGDQWTEWLSAAGVAKADGLSGPRFEHCDLTLRAAEQGQGIALAYEALISEELANGSLVKLFDVKTSPKIIYSVTCPECWIGRPKISAFRKWLFEEAGDTQCRGLPKAGRAENDGYVPAHPYPG